MVMMKVAPETWLDHNPLVMRRLMPLLVANKPVTHSISHPRLEPTVSQLSNLASQTSTQVHPEQLPTLETNYTTTA